MSLRARQEGSTLMVTMIMLAIFTLFSVTMINSGSVNLKIVGNMQAKKRVEADTQQVIEQTLSSINTFEAPAKQSLNMNYTAVNVQVPACLRQKDAPGYAIGCATCPSLAPPDQIWEVQASGEDGLTGAKAVLHQGVKIRRPVGSVCP